MSDNRSDRKTPFHSLSRRRALQLGAAGATMLGAPAILRSRAFAQGQGMDLSSFEAAKIDWRQAEGSQITIGVIPAGYFQNLEAVLGDFKKLTGIDARLEMTPPGQIRQKAVLDLSTGTGTWASHAADPMYYPLYVTNKWVAPLDTYLGNDKLTDSSWYDYEDILETWRGVTSIDGTPYGVPYDGEATLQIYRTDVYDKAGLKPAETLDDYMKNAAAVNDPGNRLWGAALRGFKGAGQNMYIYPSIFIACGGEWFDGSGKMVVNSEAAVEALSWYVKLLNGYAPQGVENWNWPDIADAFGQGTVASYIDSHSTASVIGNPEKSKVVGDIGFARWPKGPSGKRCSSIWNWSFPINAGLSDKDKVATWLFIQWATSKEVQAATSYEFDGAYKRTGANRTSIWNSDGYVAMLRGYGETLPDAINTTLKEDTDVEWRPRLPQWPAVGETMATAIQAALVGEAEVKASLDDAQAKIEKIVRG